MSIHKFLATPYDSGIILSWNPGSSNTPGTSENLCEITIQYSENVSAANIVPNTPPYVVRDLRQAQLTDANYWHPNLINGNKYTYSIFVHYLDTGEWTGPQITPATIPLATLTSPFESGSLSFSKLGTNTKLTDANISSADIVIWLPDSQASRKPVIESTINAFKPAHTKLTILYEPFYIAHTTTEQFQSGLYTTDSFTIQNGIITNKVPTIDHSFSGKKNILGGT